MTSSNQKMMSAKEKPPPSPSTSRWVCPNDRILSLRAKLDTGWSVRSCNLMNNSNNLSTSMNQLSSGFKSSSGTSYKSLNKFHDLHPNNSNHSSSDDVHLSTSSASRSSPVDLDTLDQPRPSASLLMSSSPTINSIDSIQSSASMSTFVGSGHRSGSSGSNKQQQTSFDGQVNSSISEEEQLIIIDVIKKAQQLEQMEKDRVEKLIDRLNNLKRNAKQGDGKSTCTLCSESFGRIFGSKIHFCKDCSKAVCTKCSLDTVTSTGDTIWFCKICSETREMWKKSGAWFFKSIPYYYSNYNETPRTASITSDDSSSKSNVQQRKFSSCKETSTYQMYQSSSNLSTNKQYLETLKGSSSNLSTVTSSTTINNYNDPSPSNSMVSLDSIGTVTSIQTYNSGMIPVTPTPSIATPSVATFVTSPASPTSGVSMNSHRDDISSANESSTFPSSSSFTRNKYNANSIRILSSRSPIRRKGSSRRQKYNKEDVSDNNSVASFQTISSVHSTKAPDNHDDQSSPDLFETAMNAKSRYGLQSKTSEFTASLKVKDKKLASTELWELHSDSSDNANYNRDNKEDDLN